MKRLISIVLVAAFACTVLMAGSAMAQDAEKTPIRVYLDDRTPENFVKAFEAYEQQYADSADNGALVYLAYINMLEMNRYLGLLGEGLDGLSNKQKFSYANMLLGLGRYDDAIDVYKVLNEKSPKWSCPWRHRGEAYWKSKDYENAVMCLEKAIETRETHYDAYTMLAEVLSDMGDYEKALATLEKGLTYYGKDIEDSSEEVSDTDVHFLYYDLLKRNGKEEKAARIKAVLEKIATGDERLNSL
ncbi:MAG TPA: tetratricopeptide repeat protein [Candidatus Krumholzibacterium sp.]|nr:tetratricopeptide repeat protein [Candidatus Krumholzibacterium sp.]